MPDKLEFCDQNNNSPADNYYEEKVASEAALKNEFVGSENYCAEKIEGKSDLGLEEADNIRQIERIGEEIKEYREKKDSEIQNESSIGIDYEKFDRFYDNYVSGLPRPKGVWQRMKQWWNSPDKGWRRSIIDLNDAIFRFPLARYSRFAGVIEESTDEDSSSEELAASLAAIDRFWKEYGYGGADDYGTIRLLREHRRLTETLIKRSSLEDKEGGRDKQLAKVSAGFVREDGREILKIGFVETDSKQCQNKSAQDMEALVEQIMDKYRYWRGIKKRKVNHDRFDTAGSKMSEFEKTLLAINCVLGLGALLVTSWSNDKKMETNVSSWPKSKSAINVRVDKAGSESVGVESRQDFYWKRIVKLAREKGIDVNQYVKAAMTDKFSWEMMDSENENLLLNNTDLIPGNYETFDQFKLVCVFRSLHRQYFDTHKKYLKLMTKHPNSIWGVETIGEFLWRLRILRTDRQMMENEVAVRGQDLSKPSLVNNDRVNYINNNSAGVNITKIDHSGTPLPGRELTTEMICKLAFENLGLVDELGYDNTKPPEVPPPIPGVPLPLTGSWSGAKEENKNFKPEIPQLPGLASEKSIPKPPSSIDPSQLGSNLPGVNETSSGNKEGEK